MIRQTHSCGMKSLFQFPVLSTLCLQLSMRFRPPGINHLHILIPLLSHSMAKTPPPAALKGIPYDVAEAELIEHPGPPVVESQT